MTLAPCPFCGAPAELLEGLDSHGEPFRFIGCTDDACSEMVTCRVELDGDDDVAEAQAVRAWNARVPA